LWRLVVLRWDVDMRGEMHWEEEMKKWLARSLRGFTWHICGDTWGHVHERGYNWKINKLQLEQHAGVFFRKMTFG